MFPEDCEVEMNPSSAGLHRPGGSFKRSSMGAQQLEDTDRRLSDDIYSLNSWSENLSASSSSESVAHHSTSSKRTPSSFHGRQKRDIASKTKAAIERVFNAGQTRKKRAADKRAPMVSTGDLESTLPSVLPRHSDHFHHQTNTTELSNHLDGVDGYLSQNVKPGIVNLNETDYTNMNTISSRITLAETRRPDASKDQPKLYPDLEAFKDLEFKERVSPTVLAVVVTASSEAQPLHPETHKPLVTSHKLPSYHSQTLPSSSNYTRPLLAAGNVSHQNTVTSRRLFETHANQENIPCQTTLAGRLHKSQPTIASAPLLKRQPKSSNDLESLRLSFEHRLEPENVKTKVKSVWNNIKYGWTFKSKPNFKCDSPLYILGKCYYRDRDDQSSRTEDQFLMDFVSRIWLTYRSNFYPIPGTKLSTDCGWGCMIRSGQMLIAQCLVTHFLGRDWRLYDKQTETENAFYRSIIRWFSDPIDTLSDKTPFCLHHLANFGRAYNKDPGEWYGPASVAYIFRDAFTKAKHTISILNQLCIYVAQDCTVYKDDVMKMCTQKHHTENESSASDCEAASSSQENGKWQRSLIILIPIRLGGEMMNEIYIPCVQQLLSQENCMGIIGGKPKHSLYFIGWQDDKLIYLDPHLCRDAVDTTISDFRIETYHCMTPRRLSINKMDPSCTVGFYIKDEKAFEKFVQEVTMYVSPPEQRGAYPLFIFADGHLSDSAARQMHIAPDKKVRVTHYHVDQNGQRRRTFSGDSEEFVML